MKTVTVYCIWNGDDLNAAFTDRNDAEELLSELSDQLNAPHCFDVYMTEVEVSPLPVEK